MAIDLEQHKVFSEELQTEVIPYSIVKEYIEESFGKTESKLDSLMQELSDANKAIYDSFNKVNKDLENSTRKS